jgi:2,4-dienoyl-CoA reductase (NADPH2)
VLGADGFQAVGTTAADGRWSVVVPGKGEYQGSIDHWVSEIKRLGGQIRVGREIKGAFEIKGFDEVILATGVKPRIPSIPGSDLPHVHRYDEILSGKIAPKHIIVIIGAGGIAIDTASYILHQHSEFDLDPKAYFKHWGIDPTQKSGLIPNFKPARTRLSLTLLQRSAGGMGRGLGKTTGWIHRLDLKRSGVRYLNSLSYESITPEGVSVVLKNLRARCFQGNPAARSAVIRSSRTSPAFPSPQP